MFNDHIKHGKFSVFLVFANIGKSSIHTSMSQHQYWTQYKTTQIYRSANVYWKITATSGTMPYDWHTLQLQRGHKWFLRSYIYRNTVYVTTPTYNLHLNLLFCNFAAFLNTFTLAVKQEIYKIWSISWLCLIKMWYFLQ